MFETIDLGTFIIAGLLLNITPGADLLYIASRSATGGVRAGMVAALGIGAGCLVHILGAAFGLSVILATSATAFTLVKLAGAGYLIYLGINTLLSLWRGHQALSVPCGKTVTTYRQIFGQAILVNVLNPKVALFFLAFLPQFVAPAAQQPAASFLFLGGIFNLNGTIVNLTFAACTATIAGKMQHSGRVGRVLKTAVGVLFLGLGIRLALSTEQ